MDRDAFINELRRIIEDYLKNKNLDTSTSSLDSARDDPERVKGVEGPLSINGGRPSTTLRTALSERSESNERSRTIDLVDITYRRQGRDSILRIFVDEPQGGINLETCACLNNEIGELLDQHDLMKESYVLEVSSPGVDRPLKTKSDFSRCIYKQARFFLKEQVNGKMELEGKINKVTDDSVFIQSGTGVVEIPFVKITTAKQRV